jgi:SAM-dependent methyltransferase
MDTPRNLQAGAFAGTAEAYFRYRPPYPKALLASLVTQAHLPGSPVLLDLACGPGRVTLDLTASFEHVHAIDLEAEMIEVGLREAARRGIRNVEWRVGRAEEASIAGAGVVRWTVAAFTTDPILLGFVQAPARSDIRLAAFGLHAVDRAGGTGPSGSDGAVDLWHDVHWVGDRATHPGFRFVVRADGRKCVPCHGGALLLALPLCTGLRLSKVEA